MNRAMEHGILHTRCLQHRSSPSPHPSCPLQPLPSFLNRSLSVSHVVARWGGVDRGAEHKAMNSASSSSPHDASASSTTEAGSNAEEASVSPTTAKAGSDLLPIIHKQKTSEEQRSEEESAAVWATLFGDYFLRVQSDDDMLFFVRQEQGALGASDGAVQSQVRETTEGGGDEGEGAGEEKGGGEKVEDSRLLIVRRGTASVPHLLDPSINWEESVCLNAVLHHLEYKLAVAVCVRAHDASYSKLNVVNKVTKKLWASPTKRPMDSKEGETIVTYPMISFVIDDYDLCFDRMFIHEGQLFCVQLIALEPRSQKRSTIFQGSVPFAALLALFQVSKGGWGVISDFMPGLSSNSLQFLKLKGPRGKGSAQVAVNVIERAPEQGGFFSSLTGIAPSIPTVLRACLTDVTLSCDSIVNDLMWR